MKPVGSSDITQPTTSRVGMAEYQAIKIAGGIKKRRIPTGVGLFFLFIFAVISSFGLYFALPGDTSILILGIDGGLGRGDLGRTDTIILSTFKPLPAYVGMLSIPRDLWVPIAGVGENRINTAYFFAEAQNIGDGPQATIDVINDNFHVAADYYIIVRMDGLINLIDALGGIDVFIKTPTGGLDEGYHHLDGAGVLKFVRSRAGADDFSRMEQGQIIIKALLQRVSEPDTWLQIQEIFEASRSIVGFRLPVWQIPRLAMIYLFVGQENIDARSINREMVDPFTTNQGAQVLAPNWEKINVVIDEMFGKVPE
jgi:LCP family protein required for cell wall assembly